jgi:predicted transposase/invertase (TIGR01784 family)
VATALKYSKGDELLMGFLEEVTEASKGSIGEAYDKEWAVKEAGREEGYEQGVERGIKQTKVEMIKNMMANNIPLETISKCANMSIEEVNKLLESNNKNN